MNNYTDNHNITVNSHLPEFGYELISCIPYAYYLHCKGMLKETISGYDTKPLYYFSDNHTEVDEKRSFYNTKKLSDEKVPNTFIHVPEYDLTQFKAPNYKKHYANDRFKFDKPTVIICNRFNIEWLKAPINYFSLDILRQIFDMLTPYYKVVYNNVYGLTDYYDNAEPININDFEYIEKNYPDVLTTKQLLHDNKDLTYNQLQLMLFANCERFITMNGGHSILASYFGGQNIIYTKECREVKHGYYEFEHSYHNFGNSQIEVTRDYNSLLNKIKTLWVDKEPVINILIRTNSRPNYLRDCILSIQSQTYKNYRVIIGSDNGKDTYFREYPYTIVRYKQLERKHPTHFPYNLYLNTLAEKVQKDQYIMYLDDDDMLTNENVLQDIVNEIKKGNELIFWQVDINGLTIPDNGKLWKEPTECNISGIGFCFNSNLYGQEVYGYEHKETKYTKAIPDFTTDNIVRFDEFKRSDHRMANKLFNYLTNNSKKINIFARSKLTFINKVLTKVQRTKGYGHGKRDDKIIINDSEMNKKVTIKVIKPYFGKKVGDEFVESYNNAIMLKQKGLVEILTEEQVNEIFSGADEKLTEIEKKLQDEREKLNLLEKAISEREAYLNSLIEKAEQQISNEKRRYTKKTKDNN